MEKAGLVLMLIALKTKQGSCPAYYNGTTYSVTFKALAYFDASVVIAHSVYGCDIGVIEIYFVS